MFHIILSILIIFPVLIGFGRFFQSLSGGVWVGLSSKIVSGIFLLIIFWHILAFFVPLSIGVETISVIVGWGLFLYFKEYQNFRKIDKKEASILIGMSFITIFVGAGYPFILDHFGYYVPSIKWLSEYGLVQGITNFDWILGQMSPWHIFQAGFSHFSDTFLRINVLLMLLFYLYIWDRKAWAMLCFSPILFFFLQSPSPDLPSIVFSLMILNEILQKNQKFSLLFAFSVLVFSIKPTMIWVPILTFFYPIFIFNQNLKFIILGSFVGILYLVKNLWVFGYPLFPMSLFDLGISWKPYSELFVSSGEVAILKTFDLQYSLEEIAQFSWWEYPVKWLTLKGVKGIINTAFVLSIFVFGVYSWRKKEKKLTLIFISILVKSAFVLYFSAQYRFFIEVFLVVFFVFFSSCISRKLSLKFFLILALMVMNVLFFPQILQKLVPSFNLGSVMKGVETKQFYEPSYYALNEYDRFKIGNLEFNVPKNYPFGFDVDLPVLVISQLYDYDRMGIFPQLRGKTLQEGFVWRKMTNLEKKQLKQIIEKVEYQY